MRYRLLSSTFPATHISSISESGRYRTTFKNPLNSPATESQTKQRERNSSESSSLSNRNRKRRRFSNSRQPALHHINALITDKAVRF
ncbi:unnamed protein product [Lathyrus sativus]|nr:unnamed protein product [Lathyrus sativus]